MLTNSLSKDSNTSLFWIADDDGLVVLEYCEPEQIPMEHRISMLVLLPKLFPDFFMIYKANIKL